MQLALVLACLKAPGPVPALRRLQPDRAPELLLLGGGEDAVLAGPGRRGRAAPATAGAAGQLPQHAGRDRAGQHAAEDQAGPLRLDRPREQLPGAEHLGRAGRGDAGPGQGRGTRAARRRHARLRAPCRDRAARRGQGRGARAVAHAADLLGARGQGAGVPARGAAGHRLGAALRPMPRSATASRRRTCNATNSTIAAPRTRATSRSSSTSSTSTHCTWR